MTSTLVELFRHNLWANLRLIDACRGLSDAQLDAAPAGGVFGAVRATLRHIVVNEERYLKSLLGQPLDGSSGPPAAIPSLDELRRPQPAKR